MDETKKNEDVGHALKAENIISIDQGQVEDLLSQKVRESVEETLNGLLDAEADALCGAGKYERNDERRDTRAGSYKRKLHTKAGEVELKVPKLRSLPFETQIIERYKRRESSVEEALMEMYLAGVSVRRVEDITEALWGTRVSPSTVSDLNQKLYKRIDEWRKRPLEEEYPYVYLDGICLKRTWGGHVKNVSVLVAVGVNQDGYRKILGIEEGPKEDKAGWASFLASMKERGLKGVRLIVSDKCMGLVESGADHFPDADWQWCKVHFYRDVWKEVPRSKMKETTAMLKAIHAQEDREAALKKAGDVVEKLKDMKLPKAAKQVEETIDETLSYMNYPREHWRSLATNNPLERLMKEIRRRTRVVGSFPDGESALMLAAARLRHISGTKWGLRKYLDMKRLEEQDKEERLRGKKETQQTA